MKKFMLVICFGAMLVSAANAAVYTIQNDGSGTNPVMDGYVRKSNNGAYFDLDVINTSSTTTTRRVGLVKFDIAQAAASIAAGETLDSATLTLTIRPDYFYAPGTLNVYQIGFGSDWDENATYYTYDGTNTWRGVTVAANPSQARKTETLVTAAITGTQFNPDNATVTLDVTQIVRNWTSYGATSDKNFGFVLQGDNTDGGGGYPTSNGLSTYFYSSEYSADYAKSPKLTITTVPEPASMALMSVGAVLIGCKKFRKKK